MNHYYLDEQIPARIIQIMKRIIVFPRHLVYVRDIAYGRRAPERVMRAMEFLECWELGRIEQNWPRPVYRFKKVTSYELQQRPYLRMRLRELGFSSQRIINDYRQYPDDPNN